MMDKILKEYVYNNVPYLATRQIEIKMDICNYVMDRLQRSMKLQEN